MNAILPVDFFRDGKMSLNKANDWSTRLMIVVAAGLTCFVTGCAGYVDGGYGGGYSDYGDYGGYDGGGSDLYFFGGGWDRGRDAQYYSQRGATSRGWAHSGGGGYGGGHGGGHVGGGHIGGGGGGHGGGGHGGGGGRH